MVASLWLLLMAVGMSCKFCDFVHEIFHVCIVSFSFFFFLLEETGEICFTGNMFFLYWLSVEKLYDKR